VTGSTPPITYAQATAILPPASYDVGSHRPHGRGFSRLKAPPKVTLEPAPGRRLPSFSELPPPQWAIPVTPTPIVEYRAPTPPLEDSQLFLSQPESSQFTDADEDYRPLTGRWSDIVEQEEQASAAATAVSAALATLPLPVEMINTTVSVPTMPQEVTMIPVEPSPAAPTSIASLLLSQSTLMTEATVEAPGASTGEARVADVSTAAAASAAPDTRRSLRDADITYAVRLAPAPDAGAVTDALYSSFRTTMTREQLLHTVQLLFDLKRDTSVFLTERITVAHLTDQPSDEILDEVLRLLHRFTTGVCRQ